MDSVQFRKNLSNVTGPDYQTGFARTESRRHKAGAGNNSAFAQALRENLRDGRAPLTFSRHAIQRMNSREIEVTPKLAAQLSSAVQKADGKGVKKALILSGETAFIVSVPDRTVVTTMNGGEMKENLFTNIDGAVIL